MNLEEAKREGIFLYAQKDYKAALDALLSCGEEGEDDYDVQLYVGLSYARLNKHDPAKQVLERLRAHDSNFLRVSQAGLALGFLYANGKEFDEADEILSQLDEGGLKNAQIYALWAYVAQQKSQPEAAIRRYRTAIELDPENANALNGLGFMLTETGQNLAEAIKLCKKAVALSPRNPSYLDSLGWACLRAGEKSEALEHLKRAESYAPKSEEILAHLEAARRAINER